MPNPLRAFLVDASLFTEPYDAELTEGLLAANVTPVWLVRPTRPGERADLPPAHSNAIFYRWIEGTSWIPGGLRPIFKGPAHVWGLARLTYLVWRQRPDVVHFQWVVLPLFDAAAMWLIQQISPVVVTVHDTVPFNGQRMSLLQRSGYALTLARAAGVIVHTRSGLRRLSTQGIPLSKMHLVAHGPLRLRAKPRVENKSRDPRWTFVLFGEIKPYKGVDILAEAVSRLPPEQKALIRVIVAGRIRMDLRELERRISEPDLKGTFEIRAGRLSEQEMADLFAEADSFVFPYLQIDASGVYFLVKSLGKWLVASKVGIFAESLRDGLDGRLVDAGDPAQLSIALHEAVGRTPAPPASDQDWDSIGLATRLVYEQVIAAEAGGAEVAGPNDSH